MANNTLKYDMAIFGYGFLGSSIAHVFKLHTNFKIYDKYKDFCSAEEAVQGSEFVWMCLPTPMRLSDGTCDLSIIYENVSEVNRLSSPSEKRIVIIKSTVPPGTCKDLQNKYKNITIISCPEFLTMRNALNDSITQSRIVIGSGPNGKYAADRLEELYRYRFGDAIRIFNTQWEKSEICKYGANCFFALKISYFNIIHSMCEKLDINFDEVRDLVCSDGRIAISHNNVPGWDGFRGYSGSCLIKDTQAFIHFAKSIGVDPGLLEASWHQNITYDRTNRDWEQIPSAITDDVEK